MNNIIWTKEELTKIKKIILKRTGLFFNDNNTIEYNPLNEYKINSYQEELILGINELLNIKERSEIDRILIKYSKVEFDSNNKLHYGLISTLSKININKDNDYYIQIFIILKEIICQYERIITEVAEKSFSKYTNSKELKERIQLINNGIAIEEINEINLLLNKTFNDSLNINNEEVFKEVISKCNSTIKQKLISRANNIVKNLANYEEIARNKDAGQHKSDFRKKYRHEVLGTIKKYHGGKF